MLAVTEMPRGGHPPAPGSSEGRAWQLLVLAEGDGYSRRQQGRGGHQGRVGHDLAFLRNNEDNVLAIRPGGSGDSSNSHVAWRASRGISEMPSPLFYARAAVLGKERRHGDELHPRLRERRARSAAPGRASVSCIASPVAADGRIYAASETGTIVVFRAGDTLEVLARNNLGESITATPAIADHKLYVRTANHLSAYREAPRARWLTTASNAAALTDPQSQARTSLNARGAGLLVMQDASDRASTAPRTLAVCVGRAHVAPFPTRPTRFPYDAGLKHWLSVFGPAAVLHVFAGPAAIEHGWDQPVQLGRVTSRNPAWRMAHLRLDIHSDRVPTLSHGTAANQRLARDVRCSGSFWLAGRRTVCVHGGLQQPRDSVGRVRIPVQALSRDVALPYHALPGCDAIVAEFVPGSRHGASRRTGSAYSFLTS